MELKSKGMKAIHEYLEITKEQHESQVLTMFLAWAENYISKETDWQNIIANSGIASWFMSEITELEKDFIEEVEGYDHSRVITKLDYQQMYHNCILRILDLYPKPKLEAAKKVPSGIPVMRSNGVLMFTHLNRN
jgi:hypothetical protein